MEQIKNKEYGGERPLFGSENLRLENVTVNVGESALKFCRNIEAVNCRFKGKYPFWHVDGFRVDHCVFEPGARAALWYSKGLVMTDTQVDAPKMFRDMTDIRLERVNIPDAQETMWHCSDIHLHDVTTANADYIFMHCDHIYIDGYKQDGNYSFQYSHDVEIHNAVLNTKDAFWNTENVTIYDSEINGEYLGWHSRNLRLVRCRISGSQPLCYCDGLVMEDCTLADDCDRCFEDSDLKATVNSHIVSIFNPRSGEIHCKGVGDIHIDEFVRQPANCRISSDL